VRARGRLATLVASALVGCASTVVPPKAPEKCPPQTLSLSFLASSRLNPTPDGQSRPLVVRVYELKEDARLLNASFEQVWQDDKATLADDVVKVDLSRPMAEIRAELSRYPIKTRLALTGPMVVARDIAHAKIAELLDSGQPMPAYLRDHAVYYAGPAKTPEGYPSGSFGPTTAGRMDTYVDRFQAAGGSLVMLAKGNRSAAVTTACKEHGGFYLGSIGGAAAKLAQDCITKVEVLEYPELGMEAVWRIEVRDFPAFIITDDKGHDFFTPEPEPPLVTIGPRP